MPTSFLSHLECSLCGRKYDADHLWNLCIDCRRPLLCRYDLDGVARELSSPARRRPAGRAPLSPARRRPPTFADVLECREDNIWRYRELLPVRAGAFRLTLGEGRTPLIHATQLGAELDFPGLYIKDESLNPTASFKARGLCMAVARARELGVRALSIPSAGNAAGALAAYAALGGLEAHVFMPSDVPLAFVAECRALGAHVMLVDGLITDCGRLADQQGQEHGWFDVSTLKEPYRLEGKKTMGLELAEQFGWILPDVIIYPTGGGTGLIGMWKAFDEMEQLGWIGPERPRMVTVQSEGCAPMVRAFHQGEDFAEPWSDAATLADGLRVPSAVGDFLILRALRESGGTAVAVPDEEMMEAVRLLGRTQGLFACPEGGATLAAFHRLRRQGWIEEGECVVLFNTGSGLKYSHLFAGEGQAGNH
jgi:threonine synthase